MTSPPTTAVAGTGPGRATATLSFELFPPRQGPGASAVWGRLDRLLATAPDFVSVTYRPTFVTDPLTRVGDEGGPGNLAADSAGRLRRATRVRVVRAHNPAEDVVTHVLAASDVPLMAHLTCIGYRKRDVVEIVRLFLGLGVRRFLALRGDPPRGIEADDIAGELRHADDLVRVIREVEAEWVTGDLGADIHGGAGTPGGEGRRGSAEGGDGAGGPIQIAVAAYPVAVDLAHEADVLAAKQAAGADMAITQVFYDAADYAALADAAVRSGVTMPLLPGVIPLTDLGRLTRLESLTGVRVPERLRSQLASSTGAQLVERGIGATLDLSTQLLAAGAPGLHLYTFNRTRPALDVVSHLRLGGILSGAAPDHAVQEAVSRGYLQATPGGAPAFLHGAREAEGAPGPTPHAEGPGPMAGSSGPPAALTTAGPPRGAPPPSG